MTLGAIEQGLLSSTKAYRSVHEIFSETEIIGAYLEVEKAIAQAELNAGIITPKICQAIVAACRIEALDLKSLRIDAGRVGYPIVPLVEQLARATGEVGSWIHFGATTQDVMDTALVIQIRRAILVVQFHIDKVCELLHNLAHQHRHTVMAGRSKLQHALPVTFGYKAAVWLDQLERQRNALKCSAKQAQVVQFGGGVGTLAALGISGLRVRELIADELGLETPDITWHVSRDRFANLVHALMMINAGLGKIAVDVIHLMSTEVDEVREPFAEGRGTSSTMPQKRNPVISEAILEAARTSREGSSLMMDVMLQDHERATGSSYLERRVMANALMLAAGASELAHQLLEGLEVNSDGMQNNLSISKGLMMAESVMMQLAQKIGRQSAHHLVQGACQKASTTDQNLKDVLLLNCDLNKEDLENILEPSSYLGTSDAMIDSVLKRTSR